MPKNGIIFQAGKTPLAAGEIVFDSGEEVRRRAGVLPPSENRRRPWVIFFHLLIFASLVGLFLTFWPVIYQEFSFRFLPKPKNSQTRLYFSDLLKTQTEASPQAVDPVFSLAIPKIGASASVFSNIDPAKEADYLPILQKGVAHAQGTVFPGQRGNIYLFAHSTDSPINIARYNAVFYLLKDLEPGDEVFIFFQGAKHRYQVFEKKIVAANDVSSLRGQNEQNEEILILQTCWPPGTTLQRLLVFAKKG